MHVQEISTAVKDYIGTVSAVITAIVIVYKWCSARMKKLYKKYFSQHFDNAEFIVKNWPAMYESQQQLQKQVGEIRAQVFPNGGGSMNDATKLLLAQVGEIKEAMKINLKLDTKPIIKSSITGECTFVNPAWLRLAGYADASEAYGVGWFRAIIATDRERVKSEWIEAVKTNTNLITAFSIRNIQTNVVYKVESNAALVRSIKGEPLEYIAALVIKE